MMDEKLTCNTCLYWHNGVRNSLPHHTGDCRRYPPTKFVHNDYELTGWPNPEGKHWCGEHKPVDEKEPKP